MSYITRNCDICGKLMIHVDSRRHICREFIPHYDSWIWTATPWCCGDKDSDTGYARNVRGVEADGKLNSDGAYYSRAVAPACVLNLAALNLRQSMAIVEERKEKDNATD